MKSKRKFLLISLLAASFALAGCSFENGTITGEDVECLNHIDSDSDGKCDLCGEEVPLEKQDFKGLTFKNKTFTYDGEEHFIYVDGVPDFATVKYTNNGKTEVGTYVVDARISAEGYRTKLMSAKIIIKGLTFSGITFKSQTVEYDGKKHSIEVEGLPDFATVKYTNNEKTAIGTYTVTATISADHYQDLTLTANLTIKGKTFTGITFSNKEFAYDKSYHSIYVEGLPDFASVTYKGNDKKDEGTYTVTATITAVGYETLVLTATMTIAKKLPPAILLDRTLIYTGTEQRIIYSEPEDLPSGTEATFKVDGKTVTEENFSVKTIGEHIVTVTLTSTYWDYAPSTISAKVTVIPNNFGGVDSSKTPLTIDENLKYQTLRSKILEGNFTLKEEYFDDFFYPDGSTKSELSFTAITYVDGDDVFEFFYYPEFDSFLNSQTHYTHTKLVNGEVLTSYFEDGILNGGSWETSTKMNGAYYQENVIAKTGLSVMAYLNEASDGGFEDGQEGGYVTKNGSFKIDTANNQFVEDVVGHYYHPEWNHDEHSRYTIYNIGNTTIDVPEVFDASKVEVEYEEVNDFYINGFYYSVGEDGVTMDVVMNAFTTTYLPKGTYVLPATIEGLPVNKFDYSYYAPYYDQDCSGYTFKVYFDSSGKYKGEYASLGTVSKFSAIYQLMSDGATVLFYDEWN